jgi:glutathione S-transferase
MTTNTINKPKFPPKLTLIIGNKCYSSWSLRPWLAMAAKGIPFSEVLIPLAHPNTKAQIEQYSPSGLVPVLKYGNLIVWESLAIIDFVAEKHPEAKLWPEDIELKAVARSLSMEMLSGYRALREHLPMNLRRKGPRRLSPAAETDALRITAYWKRFRMETGQGGDFLFGEFSAVDAMFAPVATRLRLYEVPLDRTSNDYIDAVLGLPAFQKWYQAAIAEPWRIDSVDNVDKPRPGLR